MKRVAILASGSGSNAENIVRYFKDSPLACIQLIMTNNPKAGVLERANRLGIKSVIIEKNHFLNGDLFIQTMLREKIDFIVLAGFLLLVPSKITDEFKNRIINIHPALLPSHGGKGFYGDKVHNAVINSGALISGVTIHYVNEKFDEGEIVFQAACHISKSDTAETLAIKIHDLEYKYFPVVIEKLLINLS